MTEGNKIHKILVVDDDLGLIKLLGAILKL
jgi:hypothetical protein